MPAARRRLPRAHPARRFARSRGRRRTRSTRSPGDALADGERDPAGRRDADGAAHARTLARSPRVLARADAHGLHRRPRRRTAAA